MDICKLIHKNDPSVSPVSPTRVEPELTKRVRNDDEGGNKRARLENNVGQEDTPKLSRGTNEPKRPVHGDAVAISENSESPNSSEYNSDFSATNSRRSTVTSVPSDDEVDTASINSCESLLALIANLKSKPVQLEGIQFIDELLQTTDRQLLLARLHQKYVEPLLDLTGYKWIRKELPSKGKGVKIFSIKYTCSQQSNCPNNPPNTVDRTRKFSNPLKQYDCNSMYSIKYIWSSLTVVITYKHSPHSPYKRLPEKLKPYILDRLQMKAVDLYNEILQNEEFSDIKHLIFFSKVQSFWSKQRIIQKEKSTKEAFERFFKD
ncbi:uncharacterized protein CANTADRAFT_26141 [Suhomyces tanzawaensis NRRL Y-17324]|uniref:Uncharacterized protein n=1 Tax=Suhomyces tanzawaensis NRRL Y-17324 TaxID=984487 RepID=A0A1E4SHT8_9ASCO|nr:uncharacterized protein CANTADRAFT_26141 [Suhomyces tanzawaensis NRRL Y-17324]ODV79079.1 hypothetical protein CANTADRAFT_26141 [Suhomyces tanzawaensis NRRL Y-17324]